jgi:hypothetical protein
MKDKFRGPLFIIGYPRSGTKLLRDLLNQNSNVGIPTVETNFIPKIIKKYGTPLNFIDDDFTRFYNDIKKTVFWRLVNIEKEELSKEYIIKNSNIDSWASIFEVILKYYAPGNRNHDFIWGDKTPIYLDKIRLLKTIFPQAKFIHIIRDPRDCCLSERKTWGKNIYRTAELWRKRILKSRSEGHNINTDYIEVFYEDLVLDPECVLKELCNFLSCKYDEKMIILEKPSENLGDTKDEKNIISNNIKKYINELTGKEIKRIEEITYPLMKSLNYEFEYNVSFIPLNIFLMYLLTLYDGISMMKFNMRDKGLLNGVKHYYQLVIDSI